MNERAVRVLLFSLDTPIEGGSDPADLLSPEELARAQRFRFDVHRRRFAVCRSLLRVELSRELRVRPQHVTFAYGPFGKPALAHETDVRFNVSHSGAYALLAIGRGGEIGVDIEEMRPMADIDGLADSVFSPAERKALSSLPASQRQKSFYSVWTRKEAYIKALGDGLSRRLEDFDVTVAPEPARLVRVAGEPAEPERWTLSALSPVAGYAAAVCVEGARPLICNWQETDLVHRIG